MEHKQKEQQDENSKLRMPYYRWNLNSCFEESVFAPFALFGFLGIILYVLIFHNLAKTSLLLFLLGFIISFVLFAFFGCRVVRYFDQRRLNNRSDNEHNRDSELFR